MYKIQLKYNIIYSRHETDSHYLMLITMSTLFMQVLLNGHWKCFLNYFYFLHFSLFFSLISCESLNDSFIFKVITRNQEKSFKYRKKLNKNCLKNCCWYLTKLVETYNECEDSHYTLVIPINFASQWLWCENCFAI